MPDIIRLYSPGKVVEEFKLKWANPSEEVVTLSWSSSVREESSSDIDTGESVYAMLSLCIDATLKIKVLFVSDSRMSDESGVTFRRPLVILTWIVSPSPWEYES
ncbi:MAG: hypothetical protein ACFFD9_00400 [Candidatus Thorarchaeota archaeon]